jgi:hypothetical protein
MVANVGRSLLAGEHALEGPEFVSWRVRPACFGRSLLAGEYALHVLAGVC